MRVVGYVSRVLNTAELNYSTTHKEILAVVWSLRHFRHLILGYPIHIRTDHAAVVELFNSILLTGKFARWALNIQVFKPTFTFLPGKVNVVADALSRYIAILQALGEGNFKEIPRKEQKVD